MKVAKSQYTFDQFVNYLVENEQEVFGSGERKQWLKVYLIHAKEDWKPLFEKFHQTKLGEILKISIQTEDLKKPVDFYIYEWSPKFLMFFTSSRREEYEKTLSKFIKFNRGISEMWINPDIFLKVKNYLLDEYHANVYKFISRRSSLSEIYAELRPDVDKRLSYTGEDATTVIKEVQKSYGVVPDSISFRIGFQKIQITSSGMFRFLSVNELSINILRDILKVLTDPQKMIRTVADSICSKTKVVRIGETSVPTVDVVSGIIKLQNIKLNKYIVEKFFKQENVFIKRPREFWSSEEEIEFSFINTSIMEGSFSFSATVVDDIKGTMFGIIGSTDQLTLIPMHRTTFESFLRFYRLIIESLDNDARFNVLPSSTTVQ